MILTTQKNPPYEIICVTIQNSFLNECNMIALIELLSMIVATSESISVEPIAYMHYKFN